MALRYWQGRTLGAALLLPLLLLSVLATSFELWRCRADGVARAACCCPTKAGARQQDADAQPRMTISRARCCDLEQHQIARDPAEATRGQTARLADLLAALATSVTATPVPFGPLLAPPVASFDPATAHPSDDPPAGRTLVVQKQSFLI